MRRLLAAAACIVALCVHHPSSDAKPASSGVYTEAGVGATGFLADMAEYGAVGLGLDLRVGYDLFSWLSIGGRLNASTHEATVPPPPEGEYFQLYSACGDARLGFNYKGVGAFVDGGIGLAMVSSNVLAKVGVLDPGEKFAVTFYAGGGVEYQLMNRHYAFGLAGHYQLYPDFDAIQSVGVRLYMRYTY